MSGRATDFWDRTPCRARRLTLIDLMAVVALIALVLAAVAGTGTGTGGPGLAPGKPAAAPVLAVACPILVGLLWFLAGLRDGRHGCLNAVLALGIVLLTMAGALLILALGYLDPATAALTCLTLPALILYLASWVR